MLYNLFDSKGVYSDPFLTLTCDRVTGPDGKIHCFDVIKKKSVASVIAVTPENKIVFVKQYRHPVRKITVELPCGHIDRNEKAAEAAVRELAEETGYVAESVAFLGRYAVSPGFTDEHVSFFLVRVEKKGDQHLDGSEDIQVVELDYLTARILPEIGLKTMTGLLLVETIFAGDENENSDSTD